LWWVTAPKIRIYLPRACQMIVRLTRLTNLTLGYHRLLELAFELDWHETAVWFVQAAALWLQAAVLWL